MSSPLQFLVPVITSKVFQNLNNAIEFAKVKIDEKTPEDTGTLLAGNKIVPARIVGSKLIASVENSVDHSEKVEFGTGRSMNYHKYTGGHSGKRIVIRTGLGARMFSLTKDIDGPAIGNIMNK